MMKTDKKISRNRSCVRPGIRKVLKQVQSVGNAGGIVLFVSVSGNDRWSGKIPEPNLARTDGPFATIVRARNEIRKMKTGSVLKAAVTVYIRGGTYYIPETITFGPGDSGSRACPVTYKAYPGESPVISGGRRITGWSRYRGKIQSVSLPEVKSGKWYFRSLFADGQRQTRARYPNIDPENPYRGGFLYVTKTGDEHKRLMVTNVFNAGDWLEYRVDVPVDGDYTFWVEYLSCNKSFGLNSMGGRTSIRVDNRTPVPLMNLPDTENSRVFHWARGARLLLKQGRHVMKWQNDMGGMINLGSFALCNDPAWKPKPGQLPNPSSGKKLLVIQSVDFEKAHSRELLILPLAGEIYSKTSFPYKPGRVKKSWAKEPDAEVHIYPGGTGCRSFKQITRLKQINEKSHMIKISGRECLNRIGPGDRFFAENIFEELDSPGEWYLDRKKGRLYFWPKKKLSGKQEVIAPVLGRIFYFKGTDKSPVRYIIFSGLTVKDTDYSARDGCKGSGTGSNGTMYLQAATNCVIENCSFLNMGKYAVCIAGGKDNSVSGNDIAFSAEGGILLLNSAGNKIIDNHIHHCGQVYKHIGGILLEGSGSGGNEISHNLIHDISRYGISLKNPGTCNLIEFNEVYNTSLETSDTGAIEVTQQDKEFRSNSVIRYNLVHDNIGYSSNMGIDMFLSWGIYLDSYAGGYTVSHNITYRDSWGGIMLQGGKDNKVFNNIFIDGGYQQVTVINFAGNSTGQEFIRNIVSYSGQGNLFCAGKINKKVIRFDRNLYFRDSGSAMTIMWMGRWDSGNRSEADFAAWQKAGFDRHSITADPLFVNPEKDNYRLKSNSPAFRLGFEPIDISNIGLIRRRGAGMSRPAMYDFSPCQMRCSVCSERRLQKIPCRHLKHT